MLIFFLGFLSGIWIGSLFHISYSFFLVLLVLAVIFFIYKRFVPEESKFILTFSLVFILSFTLGAVRVTISDLYAHSQLEKFEGQKISAEGVIVSEPDVRETNTKLTVKITHIVNSLGKFSEKVLVTTNLYPEFSYGDKVKINLILEEPKNIESEDGRVFDYKGYLRVRGIWYTSRFTQVKLISSGHGSFIKSGLFKIKHAFTNSLNRALPEPQSSLMSGLLLGTKQSLGKDLLGEFQRAGVSHVVVLSGYNIAIVATSIMSLLKFLPKNISFGFGIASILMFVILSGSGASAWRAGIMVLVALIAKRYNRNYKASRALGFAVVFMLAPNPLLLAFDPSFQLSILATIGIIFVSPIFAPYFSWVTEKFQLREIISSTIATQFTVLPFLIYSTGLVSIISLPTNILVLVTVPLTMFLGFVTGLVGLFSLYLSFVPAFFSYILLWYQLFVVHFAAGLSFGFLTFPTFSPFILVFIYFGIFLSLYFLKKKTASPF
jgi:competence protein ComEC